MSTPGGSWPGLPRSGAGRQERVVTFAVAVPNSLTWPAGLPIGDAWVPVDRAREVVFPYDGSGGRVRAGRVGRAGHRRRGRGARGPRPGRPAEHRGPAGGAGGDHRTDRRAARGADPTPGAGDRETMGGLRRRGRPDDPDLVADQRGARPAARRDGAGGPLARHRGPGRLLHPQAGRGGGRHRRVQLPAAARLAQDRAGHRRGVPGGRQTGAGDPVGHALAGRPGAPGAHRARRSGVGSATGHR